MTTYYVAKTGNNANPGTLASPWLTVDYAWSAGSGVVAGDTIKIGPGTYREDMNWAVSGTSGNKITCEAYDPYNPPILRPDTTEIVCIEDYIIFRNLIIANSPSTIGGIQLGNSTTLASGLEFYNCTFRHNRSTAMAARNTDGLIVQGCTFYGNRTEITGDGCFDIYSATRMTDFDIGWCRFFDHSADGIQWQASGNVDGDVHDCVFGILRPYGSRSWHTFSTNVGENGLDWKTTTGPVRVRRCFFFGYYDSVASQDASGSNGSAFVIHVGSNNVDVQDCRVMDCCQGFSLSQGGGVANNGSPIIRNVIAHDFNGANAGTTIGMSAAYTDNLTVEHCSFIGPFDYYWNLGPSVSVKSIRNNVMTGGTGAASGSYDRNTTGLTGETAIRHNAWHNLSTGVPTAWDDDQVVITDLDLSANLSPASTSDLLSAGENLGKVRDLIGTVRSVTPALGALEQAPSLASSANLLNFDGRNMYIAGSFDSVIDSNGEITLAPIEEQAYTFGLAVKLGADGTEKYVTKAFTDTTVLRFALYIKPALLAMTSGDRFSFVTIRGDGTKHGDIELYYDGTNVRIVASLDDDANAAHYVGTSSGFAIDRERHLIEVEVRAATSAGANNGSIELWIDGVSQGSAASIDNDTTDFDNLYFGAPAGVDLTTGDDEELEGTFYLDSIRANNTGTAIGEAGAALPNLPTLTTADANLVGYWKMQTEGSGVTRQDSGANNYDLTDVTGIPLSGLYADFERADNDRLRITDASGSLLRCTATNKVTVLGWVQPESVGNLMYMISKYGLSTNKRAYALSISSANLLQCHISSDGSTATVAVSDSTLGAGTLYMVGGTYGQGTILTYLNGARNGVAVNFSSALFASNSDFTLGCHSDVGNHYDGLMNRVAVFSRELSGAEIESYYTNGISEVAGGVIPVIIYALRQQRIL